VVNTAIILAGGLGTRLRSVVPDLPKPMAPVGGRPFLTWLMDYWMQQGIHHFILSVGYRYKAIVDCLGSHYKGATIKYVIEEAPLGTGGGLLLAAHKMDPNQPFLLLNGDTYFPVDLHKLTAFAEKNNVDWCFSLFRHNEPGRYMGIDLAADGLVAGLKSPASLLANGGVYWVHPRCLRYDTHAGKEKISLEDELFPAAMIAGQKLMGLEFNRVFIDIGVPADYQRAAQVLV